MHVNLYNVLIYTHSNNKLNIYLFYICILKYWRELFELSLEHISFSLKRNVQE